MSVWRSFTSASMVSFPTMLRSEPMRTCWTVGSIWSSWPMNRSAAARIWVGWRPILKTAVAFTRTRMPWAVTPSSRLIAGIVWSDNRNGRLMIGMTIAPAPTTTRSLIGQGGNLAGTAGGPSSRERPR